MVPDAAGTSNRYPSQGPRREDSAHLLKQLKLPSRYESLSAEVGPAVASLLVSPSETTLQIFRKAALHIRSKGRGLFLPVYADSGTGKTTLISNLSSWIPDEYGPSIRLAGGEVTADRLRQAVSAMVQEERLPSNDKRIFVINVDDRESDLPTDKELSQIKSFVRESGDGEMGLGSRTLIVWPETSKQNANLMAKSYEERAGNSPVSIPAEVEGPSRDTWSSLATATLKLVNSIEHLDLLGVDPNAYEPNQFPTVGDFLDAISGDFVELLHELLESTRKPISLVIVLASESGKVGVLSDLTSGYRYGLVDADKLVAATPLSSIGRWWADRKGALIQTIVRLNARIVFVTPSLSVPVIHRYGPHEVKELLSSRGVSSKPPSEITTYFERSDFGRVLSGAASAASETRGNPAAGAALSFRAVATGIGFNSGKDKRLNRAFGDFLVQSKSELGEVAAESKIEGLPLIPDISLTTDAQVTCLELHWRSGDFLTSAHRSEIAQYVLQKLKNYAVELSWISN